jgi:glutathione synthase/RimK-type ligase-like ATP-grasp enzyme
MPGLVGVFREAEFSPGRVEDDAAILERTAVALAARGLPVRLGGTELLPAPHAAAILTMCQSAPALAALERHSAQVTVINTPCAIRSCYRAETVRLLTAAGVPFAPTRIVATQAPRQAALENAAPCWVKRGDVHAMTAEDVVFAATPSDLEDTLEAYAARGIKSAALQEHVDGSAVKFYGIVDGRFFRCYSDAAEPRATTPRLWKVARAGAAALGLEIFGGDMVITPAGMPVLIDVNDWPSFKRCREEAAEAIAGYVGERLAGGGRVLEDATLMARRDGAERR